MTTIEANAIVKAREEKGAKKELERAQLHETYCQYPHCLQLA